MAYKGSIFGFSVSSEIPLNYLRHGGGENELKIVESERWDEPSGEPVLQWNSPEGKAIARVYAEDGTFAMRIRHVGRFAIDPAAGRIAVTKPVEAALREACLWGVPAALCFIRRGDLPLHASAVEIDGKAVIFAGPGRRGKTTLAAAFLRAGYRLLSEDLCCCRVSEAPVLFPGPALIRVRSDAAQHLEIPGTHPVATYPMRVHLAMDDDRRGDGTPIPIAGLFLLREADEIRMQPLSVAEALPELFALSYKIPDPADIARSFASLTDLAGRVPIWNFYRPLRFDRLEQHMEAVVHTVTAGTTFDVRTVTPHEGALSTGVRR